MFFRFHPIFVILTVVLVGISSCNTKNYRKEIAQIDNLLLKIDSAEFIINSLDTAAINHTMKDMRVKGDLIKKLSTDKEVSKEMTFKISNLMSAKKGFKEYRKHYTKIKEEIPVARKQLNDLKKDLANGSWEKTEMEKHLATESHIVTNMVQTVTRMQSGSKSALQEYKTMEPELSSLLEELTFN